MIDLQPVPGALIRGCILAVLGLLWIIVLIRIVGLRSLSKMTSFDFVVTVALGSLLATVATVEKLSAVIQAAAAAATLLLVQLAIARSRLLSRRFHSLVQNQPLLLMLDGEFIEPALQQARVSREDLLAKLREANVRHREDVRAVVLETTGDVSVLHGDSLEPELLRDVGQPD